MGLESESLAAFALTKKLLATLVASANPDDFCRSLVHNVFADKGAIAAFICRAEGKTNWQIANLLKFSESTVKGDASLIYRAFGLKTREAAVDAARAAGLL